jgi:arylsulfatase A-like enzyme
MVQNGWLSARRGFARGFDRFSGHADLNAGWRLFDRFSWVRWIDRVSLRRIPEFDPETDSDVITRAATERIRAWSDAPFFLYVHYFEPHWPYHPPEESRRRHDAPADTLVNHVPKDGVSRGRMIFANPLPEAENEAARRLYRAEVDHTLASVGRLNEQLDDNGLAEDTIVVFTADHGHALGEHDYHFHHGSFLYEPELRIPLVVRYPREIAGGRVVSQTVRSIDVLPTILELAGIEAPADLDGRSLVPLLHGKRDAPRAAYLESDVKMFVENTRREIPGQAGVIRGLRTDRFKFLLHATREGPREELFDLPNDPGETRDLARDPAYADDLARLREALLAYLPPEERAALGSTSRLDAPSADDLEQLRALGYIE